MLQHSELHYLQLAPFGAHEWSKTLDQLGRFAELGATRVFLQIIDLSDLDHLDVIASEVAPQLP